MANFKVGTTEFEEMSDAAQEAEFQHPADVVALTDGMFHKAGETVYTSKGSPDDD